MYQVHVCQTCRLQARLHKQLHLLQLARRGFNGSAPAWQSASVRHWQPDRSPQDHNERTARREVSRKGRPSRFLPEANEFVQLPQRGIDPTPQHRGRYSGRPLRPEDLLTKVEQTPTFERRQPQGHIVQQRMRVKKDGYGSPALPISLSVSVDQFISCGSDGARDAEAWRLLQTLSTVHGHLVEIKVLGQHSWFMKAYIGFTMRCCNRVTTGSDSYPRPSQVLELLPIFGIEADQLWVRTLWQVSSNIVEFPSIGSPESAQMAKESAATELMRLWNMCLATHLKRHNGNLQSQLAPTEMDWTFLPDPVNFANLLSQGQAHGKRPTFADSLHLLFPIKGGRKSKSWGQRTGFRQNKPADLPSAALVTLDILRDTTKADRHHQFIRLLENILRVVDTPEVPEALQNKLDSTEGTSSREQYASIVQRRLGFLDPSKPTVARQPAPTQSTQTASPSYQQMLSAKAEHSQGGVDEFETEPAITSSATSDPADLGDVLLDMDPPTGESKASPDSMPASENGLLDSDTGLPTPVNLASRSTSPPSDAPSSNLQTSQFAEVRITRLGQAIEKKNLPLAERIKDEVLNFLYFAPDPAKPQLPDEVYEQLMLTLLSLRSPQSAIQVWNHFIQLGRQPTAKTYTIMMRGAQHVQDVKGLEAFWNKMRDAGIQPDGHAWSVRIFGLIRAGKVEAGLNALSQMGQEWFTAARAKQASAAGNRHHSKRMPPNTSPTDLLEKFEGEVDGVPRPTLEVMNAALSALASRNDTQISKVIAWGRPFGLEPDHYTYNVLLNIAMRHGEGDSAMAILKRMQERNIMANSTTWTVLLTALFEGGSLDGLSPENQQSQIISFMSSLETAAAAGIDAKGYALVIDRLLKFYANSTAANAVLQIMTSKGMKPTAHIYTILMSSYFDHTPHPDFAAAEALWAHIQASDAGRGAALDSFFYDRVIEGYATHHRITGPEPMLRFLQSCLDVGKKPSWRALDAVARALAERNDWNRLLQVVDSARRLMRDESKGEFMVGEQKRFGQRDFWKFIVETGLLRQEGIITVEQIMGKSDRLSTLERAERRAAVVH